MISFSCYQHGYGGSHANPVINECRVNVEIVCSVYCVVCRLSCAIIVKIAEIMVPVLPRNHEDATGTAGSEILLYQYVLITIVYVYCYACSELFVV